MKIEIEVPEALKKSLRKEESIEEAILEALVSYLGIADPEVNAEIHKQLCEKYLSDGERFMGEGDFIQASEKFWGAASQIVKVVAAKSGEELETHWELWNFVGKLVEESGDDEIGRLWAGANALHKNFYEAKLPESLIRRYINDVKKFCQKLKALVGG